MTDLSFCSVEEIFEELRSRYDGIILMTEKDAKNEDWTTYGSHFKGSLALCLGLTYMATKKLLSDDEENEGEGPDE